MIAAVTIGEAVLGMGFVAFFVLFLITLRCANVLKEAWERNVLERAGVEAKFSKVSAAYQELGDRHADLASDLKEQVKSTDRVRARLDAMTKTLEAVRALVAKHLGGGVASELASKARRRRLMVGPHSAVPHSTHSLICEVCDFSVGHAIHLVKSQGDGS